MTGWKSMKKNIYDFTNLELAGFKNPSVRVQFDHGIYSVFTI